MKIVKIFMVLCGLLFLVQACKTKTYDVVGEYVNINPLEATKAVDDLSSYIESVEIIELVTPDSIFIPDITKLLFTKTQDMIVLCNRGIYKFDKKGNYLFSFGALGRGPGEYIKIYDICLNVDGSQLIGIDQNERLLKYSLDDGSFLSLVDTKHYAMDASGVAVAPAEKDNFFVYYPNPDEFRLTSDFYSLVKYNRSGTIVEKTIKRTDYNIEFSAFPFITQGENNVYYLRPQEGENIYYKIHNGEIEPLLRIHFGKKNIEHKWLLKNKSHHPISIIGDYLADDSFKIPMYLQETTDQIYFASAGPNARMYNFLIDKDTHKGIHWHSNSKQEYHYFYIWNSLDRYFYGVFADYNDYLNMGEEIELDPLMHYLAREKKIQLDKMGNPKIIKLKFNLKN